MTGVVEPDPVLVIMTVGVTAGLVLMTVTVGVTTGAVMTAVVEVGIGSVVKVPTVQGPVAVPLSALTSHQYCVLYFNAV